MSNFTVLKSNDRAETWEEVAEITGINPVAIQDASNTIWIAFYDDSAVAALSYTFSVDGGENWADSVELELGETEDDPPAEIIASDGAIGFVYDISGRMMISFLDVEDNLYIVTTDDRFENYTIAPVTVPEVPVP